MSHGHSKKTHKKDHDEAKTKKAHHGDDQGKLSDAMKGKDGDDDEVTPGYQPVTPDMPTDIQADMVDVQDAGKDPYTGDATVTVTASAGAAQGVVEEMKAYLVMNNGDHLAINITTVREGATVGTIEGTSQYYILQNSARRIVINPSTPHKKHDKKKKHHHG